MNKNMIGLILTGVGFLIIVITLSLFTFEVFYDIDAMGVCQLSLAIGGLLLFLGIFILVERFKGWARR